jgi:hypothetical protein
MATSCSCILKKKSCHLLCLGMHAHDFQLNFFSMYQNYLMYQRNLNVFEKHMVNNNWLQLKNHGKHNLYVIFHI